MARPPRGATPPDHLCHMLFYAYECCSMVHALCSGLRVGHPGWGQSHLRLGKLGASVRLLLDLSPAPIFPPLHVPQGAWLTPGPFAFYTTNLCKSDVDTFYCLTFILTMSAAIGATNQRSAKAVKVGIIYNVVNQGQRQASWQHTGNAPKYSLKAIWPANGDSQLTLRLRDEQNAVVNTWHIPHATNKYQLFLESSNASLELQELNGNDGVVSAVASCGEQKLTVADAMQIVRSLRPRSPVPREC